MVPDLKNPSTTESASASGKGSPTLSKQQENPADTPVMRWVSARGKGEDPMQAPYRAQKAAETWMKAVPATGGVDEGREKNGANRDQKESNRASPPSNQA